MSRPRFNVATILLVLPVIALGCMAVLHPSDIWASGLFTLTLGLLATATLCALLGPPRHRAAWIGCSVFGWSYLVFTFLYVDYRISPRPVRSPQLLTDMLVGFLVPENTHQGIYLKGIAHSIATVLSGLIGAWAGGLIASREPGEETRSSGGGDT